MNIHTKIGITALIKSVFLHGGDFFHASISLPEQLLIK